MSGDLALARHLVAALRAHRRQIERDGGAVPVGVRELEDLAQFRVNPGQEASSFGVFGEPAEAVPVTAALLTVRQAGDVLACSDSTVKRLIREGAVPTVRLLGSTRIRVADLNQYVESLDSRWASTSPDGARLAALDRTDGRERGHERTDRPAPTAPIHQETS